MKMKHLIVVLVMSVGLLVALSTVECAKVTAKEVFPKKNITWIVPYPPGGGFDVYSRAVAPTMRKYLPKKVHIIIKNVPGAGSTRGASVIYRSKPDGYTIGIINSPGLNAAAMIMKTEYDLEKYVFLGRVAITRYCLSVPKGSPFRSLKDLQGAKKTVRFSTTGRGDTGDLVTRIGSASLKIPTQLVTGYRASTNAIIATMRGDADAVLTGGIATQLPFIKAGDIKPLLVFSAERSEYIPDTPTVKELGYDGGLAQLALHRFIAAPPGTPEGVAGVLSKALKRTLEDDGFRKWAKEAQRPLAWASGEQAKQIVSTFSKMLKKYEKVLGDSVHMPHGP